MSGEGRGKRGSGEEEERRVERYTSEADVLKKRCFVLVVVVVHFQIMQI